jgi:hypothetical protein
MAGYKDQICRRPNKQGRDDSRVRQPNVPPVAETGNRRALARRSCQSTATRFYRDPSRIVPAAGDKHAACHGGPTCLREIADDGDSPLGIVAGERPDDTACCSNTGHGNRGGTPRKAPHRKGDGKTVAGECVQHLAASDPRRTGQGVGIVAVWDHRWFG